MNFTNKPYPDFSQPDHIAAIRGALMVLEESYFGREWPHILGGQEVYSPDCKYHTIDPNQPDCVIGTFQGYDPKVMNIDGLLAAANAASRRWFDAGIEIRAAVIEKAADLIDDRIMLIAAAVVAETGKSYIEAYADVAEGIDFLRYDALLAREEYAAPLIKTPARCGNINRRVLVPHGVFLTLDPFNFQVAIGIDQMAKPLLMGNSVIASPSDKASLCGRLVFAAFCDAFAMQNYDSTGIVNFAPGGADIAKAILANPGLAGLCFTGSATVLDSIIQAYGMLRRHHGGKLVIASAETSGVDAMYVHEDADLDVAAAGAAAALCGLSGQKCSALSTVIAHETIAETLLKKIAAAIDALSFGSTREGASLGAVISQAAKDRISVQTAELRQDTGAEEAYVKVVDDRLPGFIVPPTVLRVTRDQWQDESVLLRLRNTEIFGPVCTLIPVRSAAEAEYVFNCSDFALTGGICAEDPALIEHAIQHFRAGNFYVNRKITGALVGSEPFGGLVSKSSLTGISAGSRHALTLFYSDKTISGFVG